MGGKAERPVAFFFFLLRVRLNSEVDRIYTKEAPGSTPKGWDEKRRELARVRVAICAPVSLWQVDSFPGLGKEMLAGRDFSPESRPALDDIYGVKSAAGGQGEKSAAA